MSSATQLMLPDQGTTMRARLPLPGAATTYTFFLNDCPSDGSYTVINSTSGCFGSSWHVITEDHTPGDVNGYMMLVNASFNPGDFYVDTVRGLCASTTYDQCMGGQCIVTPFLQR